MSKFRLPRWGWILLGLLALPAVVHGGLLWLSHLPCPGVAKGANLPVHKTADGLSRGRSFLTNKNGLTTVHLVGDATELGRAQPALLREGMIETERRLRARFDETVPHAWARWLLMDLARARFFDVDRGMRKDRLLELAAIAQGFQPDPFADWLPTYQRLVYLNALYDIALGFEGSPLLGCTTVVAHGSATQQGHSLLARNFDFEVDDVFDRRKVVYLVEAPGEIPFASVAWPGSIGVVTGMNAKGVGLVAHGARAGAVSAHGEPLLHALRFALSHAQSAGEALDLLAQSRPMVSHLVIVADGEGSAWVLERVPDQPPYRYRLPQRAAVTNHLVGPLAEDEKNQRVKEQTTTLQRQQRAAQLMSTFDHPIRPVDLASVLRDRKGINDTHLELGDRRALDALIATHGVVMDLTARRMWVSRSPHLLGRFEAYDLDRAFGDQPDPALGLLRDQGFAEDPLLAQQPSVVKTTPTPKNPSR